MAERNLTRLESTIDQVKLTAIPNVKYKDPGVQPPTDVMPLAPPGEPLQKRPAVDTYWRDRGYETPRNHPDYAQDLFKIPNTEKENNPIIIMEKTKKRMKSTVKKVTKHQDDIPPAPLVWNEDPLHLNTEPVTYPTPMGPSDNSPPVSIFSPPARTFDSPNNGVEDGQREVQLVDDVINNNLFAPTPGSTSYQEIPATNALPPPSVDTGRQETAANIDLFPQPPKDVGQPASEVASWSSIPEEASSNFNKEDLTQRYMFAKQREEYWRQKADDYKRQMKVLEVEEMRSLRKEKNILQLQTWELQEQLILATQDY